MSNKIKPEPNQQKIFVNLLNTKIELLFPPNRYGKPVIIAIPIGRK
ncbi:MAG: hypothetical protein H7174_06220 [Flavobacterium sp.]|nr:hypothetical protein [Flavobacterium sp.]